MSKDNTELEEQLDRRRVSFGLWKIVSDMLDNPGEHGIYPTSECYDRLDEKAQALITEARIDELRPLQASVDRDDLLLLIEERLAELDRLTQLKENK